MMAVHLAAVSVFDLQFFNPQMFDAGEVGVVEPIGGCVELRLGTVRQRWRFSPRRQTCHVAYHDITNVSASRWHAANLFFRVNGPAKTVTAAD